MENSFLYYHVLKKSRIITKKGKFLNNNEITNYVKKLKLIFKNK